MQEVRGRAVRRGARGAKGAMGAASEGVKDEGTSMKMIAALSLMAVVVALPLGILAQSGEQRIAPAEVKWPAAAAGGVGTSGVGGIQTVVLKGDPAKPGLYTLLLRVGPNTKIEAHAHADDRVATVVSGTWYFGYGKQFDEKALKALPA